jgi:predicted SPOUT superfamily RNA methylase MTH1
LNSKNKIKFELAIPDSYLYDVKSDIDRTAKIFQLSRSLSIFRVEKLTIYHDSLLNPTYKEREFLITILEYLDTPQYLRRKIYPKLDILKTVGRLHPLRSPHHKDKDSIRHLKSGEVRVGLLEKKGREFLVDVGLDYSLKYVGNQTQFGKKLNVKLIKQKKHLLATDPSIDDLKNLFYWGYSVHYTKEFRDFIYKFEKSKVILTSRYAKQFDGFGFVKSLINDELVNTTLLVVFGSPKYGLKSIFEAAKIDMSEYKSYNFFPSQGTQTIRMEEAIFGVLSILNFYTQSY